MSSELGRDPEGKSLRIAAMKAAEEATKEAVGEDPVAIDKLADEVDAALKSIGQGELSQEAMEGGRRRKVRGGQPKRVKTEEGSAAAPTTTSKTEYLKKVGAAILEYAQKEVAPIAPSGMAVATGAVGLVQELVVRVPVTLITLTLSGTALSVKFFKALFAKFNSWGRTTAEQLRSDLTAEQAADAAVKDIPSIARTATVGVVFFNQLGLLPISAVLAAILFAVRANVSTGPARSLLISQFYAWYIMKPKKEQEAFIKAAKDYAAQAATAGSVALDMSKPAVQTLVSSVGNFVQTAGVGISSAAASFSSSSSSSAAAPTATAARPEDILTSGAPAAAVVGQVVKDAGADTVDDSKAQVKSREAVVAVVSNAEKGVASYSKLLRRPLGPRKEINLEDEESSSLTTARRTSARNAKTSLELPPGTTQGPPSTKSEPSKGTKRTRGQGGKRKTVRKIKRRVTRRKPKMPTFVY
jgi:hypothetical protein